MKVFNIVLLSGVSVAILSMSLNVQAEARRDGGAADPLRRAQYVIRQLSQEKSRLEAETARLNAENKSLLGQIESLEQQVSSTEGKLDQSQQSNYKLVDRIKSDVEKYKQLIEKYKETVAILRTANKDNEHLVQAVNERENWIAKCNSRNSKMYEANIELLDRYNNKSAWDSIKHREPLTGLALVEFENQVQDYQFRLEDLQMTPFSPSLDHQAHVRTQK